MYTVYILVQKTKVKKKNDTNVLIILHVSIPLNGQESIFLCVFSFLDTDRL